MAKKQLTIEALLKEGSKQWNNLRKEGKVGVDHTGATFSQLYSANADLSALMLIGSEWEKCDLSKVSFRDTDLSNAYFHGGRLQECDFRGVKLDGCTFERMKLLRCDFTGATGIEETEFDDCDMDRVVGLDGEEAPPPPPPPVVGVTSFTREQRSAVLGNRDEAPEPELPPFRPQDPPASLLFRAMKHISNPPVWVLDVPELKLPVPVRMMPGTSLEHLYREAVKTRLEGRRPVPDNQAVVRARDVIQHGTDESHLAVMYLFELGEAVPVTAPAIEVLMQKLRAAIEIDDATGDVDPRVTGALLALRATKDPLEHIGEFRMRLAAAQLFFALLEAGFAPDNNWEEAVDSIDTAQDLAHVASNGAREVLPAAFHAFASLPEEVRLRRLAYLAEAAGHLEAMVNAGAE